MPTNVQKRKPSKPKPKESTPFISPERKKEVLGIILIVVCVLVSLAIMTYDQADNLLAQRFSWNSLLSPGSKSAVNALGLTGATIARVLVPRFLGYCVILLPLTGMLWGYALFRNRDTSHLTVFTTLAFFGAYLLATLFGWFGLTLEVDLMSMSGTWGAGTAGWMQRIVGTTGSVILLVAILGIFVLLMVDRDIQRTMDRVENRFAKIRQSFWEWRAGREVRKEERIANKDRLVAEKRTQRDSSLKQEAHQREEERLVRAAQQREEQRRKVVSTPPVSPAPPTPVPHSPPAATDPESGDDVEIIVHEQKVEEKASRSSRNVRSSTDYGFRQPGLDLLDETDARTHQIDYDELEENKQILFDKLATYNIEIIGIEAIIGPTVTLYELTPAPGVKISRITSLENDLAMALAAKGIRMIAPIPGKSAIGVEIPNRHRELVRIRDIIETKTFQQNDMQLPLILGKSIEGEIILQDLTKMPHVLIAGATGSGKSVGVNTFIAGLLYSVPPSLLKFVMIDPKKIELSAYARITSHYVAMPPEADDAIITDFSQALGTLKSCEKEMEGRYDLLSAAQVRSVKDYNERFKAGGLDPEEGHRLLPYIVVVVDELADLMMTAGKDIEGPIARLAQMARAVGIHLILATQRPSVDVITGLIKANFPSRIAYQVASKIDSRTILDHNGAQGLVGNGDLLYMLGSRITRLQGPFISNSEIDRLTGFIGDQEGPGPYLLPSIEEDAQPASMAGSGGPKDELFVDAARIIVRAQQGSVSLLQRKLSVGYSRAARIVDQLEDAGIVGPFEGSKARQVYVEDEVMLDQLLSQ
ncbi:MAG: DNA translocase FtsK [Bacteroidetes Order II. Incertae sedis bacterium]|jgi:S-DNA-T family DNA segregation ATPase FtsK/SpoIIIE|nr:DNA translocase FtsK [Bacteroidetes Order II. bacterium]MBT6200251.1 DNA translocase FtsK [Bacteroidetes Order II. bacterium]MBT6581413.1 DNA translocase FtsK [Bacteroidetes Order II. bacterium]